MVVTHSRAAIICFGGWGLQVMLHLWPRLRFVQDERNYLGLPLPNLDQLATFACLMPLPYFDQESSEVRGFRLLEPKPDNYPEPYYVERQLLREASFLQGAYTEAERTADMLFRRALTDRYISDLSFKGVDSLQNRFLNSVSIDFDRRMSRQLMFRLSIAAAEAVARGIVQKIIDPTLFDQVQPYDPLVQTNIYVVAPLTEPLAAAMIWPVIAELVSDLGKRSVCSVTAFFLTGSFASDHTRPIEDATTYAALAELEALTGLRQISSDLHASLKELMKHKSGWEQRIGEHLFSQIYLIDREKSNLSLARDPHELAVLTSNVIEAFIVADVLDYVQKQAVQNRAYPYRIIGSANDYIPLREYYQAAIEEETRRIIRETFLIPPTDYQSSDSSSTTSKSLKNSLLSLQQLNITPREMIDKLLHDQAGQIFEPSSRRQAFLNRIPYLGTLQKWQLRVFRRQSSTVEEQNFDIPNIRVARSYILDLQDKQSRLPRELWYWIFEIQQRSLFLRRQLAQNIDQYGARTALGCRYYENENQHWFNPNDIDSTLYPYRTQTWPSRYRKDGRTIPQVSTRIFQYVITTISRHPQGFNDVRDSLGAFIDELENILASIQQTENRRINQNRVNNVQTQLRSWLRDYQHTVLRLPRHSALIVRLLYVASIISFPIIGWVLFEQPVAATGVQIVATVILCMTLVGLILLLTYIPMLWQDQRIRTRLIALSQEELSAYIRDQILQRLQNIYRELLADIRITHSTIEQAITMMQEMAKPTDVPAITPPVLHLSHLRRAHTSEQIWQDVQQLVREYNGLGKVYESWQKLQNDTSRAFEMGDHFIQRLCRALELGFNFRDLITTIQLTRQKSGQSSDINNGLLQGLWCPFAPDNQPRNVQKGIYCTACIQPQPGCIFSQEGMEVTGMSLKIAEFNESIVVGGKLIASLVHEFVSDIVRDMLPQQRSAKERSQFFQKLLKEYNIERMICKSDNGSELSRRDFVEEFYVRAKPAAHREVVDTFRQDVREIEVAVTSRADESVLRTEMERRNIKVISSFDPAAITMIRLVDGLSLDDLTFCNRCKQEFSRLTLSDYDLIGLVDKAALTHLYSRDTSVIPYDEPML